MVVVAWVTPEVVKGLLIVEVEVEAGGGVVSEKSVIVAKRNGSNIHNLATRIID